MGKMKNNNPEFHSSPLECIKHVSPISAYSQLFYVFGLDALHRHEATHYNIKSIRKNAENHAEKFFILAKDFPSISGNAVMPCIIKI